MKTTDIRRVAAELLKLEPDASRAARLCVAGYASLKRIAVPKNGSRLGKIVASLDWGCVMQASDIFLSCGHKPTIEDVVGVFELLVPDGERKKNGVAYTPLAVKEMMLRRVMLSDRLPRVYDPACGCGAFLMTAAQLIHDRFAVPYRRIVSESLVGSDISEEAVERVKMLSSVLLAENGERDDVMPQLYCLDMLNSDSIARICRDNPDGFDCVVGNPPYVRFRNMDRATQSAVAAWRSSAGGNADLYMPFFEIGWRAVGDRGTLSFITPNTYLQSVNGRSLRKWIADVEASAEISDFRDAQLFDNVTCYTCVTVLSRAGSRKIRYRRLKAPGERRSFTEYDFADFGDGKPWRMRDGEVDAVISRLEHFGRPLGEYVIRNGLATLGNDIFFFKPLKSEGDCFVREYDGRRWKIEKGVCRNIVKPNVIHTDRDLISEMEQALFPYNLVNGRYVVKSEAEMMSSYPKAYEFLSNCREKLANRDKGQGNYPAWFAYGRTQGMNCRGAKLLIPYIAGAPTAVLAEDPDLLFYCGYALIGNDVGELRYVRKFMESDAFWYYLYHTSKPYSKGYMALAKNYIVGFSIPQLAGAERDLIMETKDPNRLNEYIWHAYGIADIPEVPEKAAYGISRDIGRSVLTSSRLAMDDISGYRATGTDDVGLRHEQMMLLKKRAGPLKRRGRK